MSAIDTLTELFMRFPGIGPRQARRFVYFLLKQDDEYRAALVRALSEAVDSVRQCLRCQRFAALSAKSQLCTICNDPNRSLTQLMLVEKDTDLEQMEKSGAYTGHYFVLGGTLSLTGKTQSKKSTIREQQLADLLRKESTNIEEIIIALSATPDGEHTMSYLTEKLQKGVHTKDKVITLLGRGLSTGSELEYADSQTLEQALKNRA